MRNPAYKGPKAAPKPPRRPRTIRRPRQGQITVYQVHCKACSKRYELAYTGNVKFCIFCASDKIEKSIRNRKETPAEREERNRRTSAHLIDFGLRFISGMLGFQVPEGFTPTPPPGINGKSELEAELLKEGYRKLATKYHPDKGGDPEKMKELNRLKERLGL